MGVFEKNGGREMTEPIVLVLQNKEDREAVALSLFRAGYTVREKRRKGNGKTTVFLEYWREPG